MNSVSACLLAFVCGLTYTNGHNINFETSRFIEIKGQAGVSQFVENKQVRLLYFYKKDKKMTTFFLQELEKSSEFLEMYGVKIGFCDCSQDVNKDVTDCKKENIDTSVHTYRLGNLLLSLELQTMFDVNSIMSNVLQLVMLREVPILQTMPEVEKFLSSMKGKKDIVFGHMKAIGTSDHRVFMEVAYAYTSKLQFVVCTDTAATKLFEKAPGSSGDTSSVWWVWTKQMGPDDSYYQNIRYKEDLSLKALAKFANIITKPKMVDIVAEGTMDPYANLNIPIVRFYYDTNSREDVYQKAHTLTRYYGGSVGVLLINCDSEEIKMRKMYSGKLPAMSVQLSDDKPESFLNEELDTDNIAKFMVDSLGGDSVYPKVPEDDDVMQEDFAEQEGQFTDNEDEMFDANIEAVEKQDDKVAAAVDRVKNIKMSLDLVPALTDKTFPQTLADNPLTVVLLYLPFDALSMGNLRMFGEVADMLGKQTSLKVARVNCYDWTDVCQNEHINIYPTLRVYRNGRQAWDYRGPQDTQAMYSTLKLLELSSPVYESDSGELLNYITNNQKNVLQGVTNTTVVGLFRKEDKKEMEVFKTFAESCRDRIMFVYSDIEDCSVIAQTFGAKLPAVILSKYDDTIQPHAVFNQKYTTYNLQQFVNENKLPKLTILTPLMLPEVRKKFSDLVILFTDESDVSVRSEEAVREVVKSQKFNNVSFNMMPVPDTMSVGYRVLNQYTQEPTVPHLSLVNFQKGEVFNFGAVSETSSLTSWLTNVVAGSTLPSTTLKHGEWKPLNKGYEFLKIIEWEEQQARKKEAKKAGAEQKMKDENNNQADDLPPEEVDSNKFQEDAEESDTRKDLFDLNKSRLYHQAPGRVGHHGNQDTMATKVNKGEGHSEGINVGHDGEELQKNGDQNMDKQNQKGRKHDPSEL